MDINTLQSFLKYSDWANGRLLAEASHMSDAQLDQIFEIGPGSLRKTLKHICDGEMVWLARWEKKGETRWPPDNEILTVPNMQDRFANTWRERAGFFLGLTHNDLAKVIIYRDSKGSLFDASLGDMILQGILHSGHHRAQAVNILRRLGAGLVELDYMMWVRRPASV